MNLTINNRELLRNYKSLKAKLLSGEIQEISIPQKGEKTIKITVEEELSPMQHLIKMIEEHGPFNIERPEEDIFDW